MIELAEHLTLFEAYDVGLVVAGLAVLALATVLRRFRELPFSFPILALALGYVAFSLPLGLPAPEPLEHRAWALHVTELGVIISLFGVGLKIDRIPDWRTWSPVWRLLGICMPLTMLGVGLLGWGLVGLTPAAAMLLAASLAPTDPVLAADVQVGKPDPDVEDDTDTPADEREDDLRFALTAEAGLNDSLAFPFTYVALLMLTHGVGPANWVGRWVGVELVYRVAVGVGLGLAVGRLLSRVLLSLPVETEEQRMRAGVAALAATLLLYGGVELVGGYGFLAVFIGALAIRHGERTGQNHVSLHVFAEQAEELLMTVLMLALGAAIAGGLLAPLTWQGAVLGLLLVFVLRPVAGMLSLVGEPRLDLVDRAIASSFGIRGIGCLFYLAYGMQHGSFGDEVQLWAVCGFAVALSVVVHGVAASPVIRLRDRRVAAREAAA